MIPKKKIEYASRYLGNSIYSLFVYLFVYLFIKVMRLFRGNILLGKKKSSKKTPLFFPQHSLVQ